MEKVFATEAEGLRLVCVISTEGHFITMKMQKQEGMRSLKSIMADDLEHCIFCHSPYVEMHHVFFGVANRPKSDKHGLIVPLCKKHHTGSKDCPHQNRIIDLSIKSWGQAVYENEIGTREQFIEEFGRNYL